MGLWDDLNKLLRRGRKKATEEAAKAAAREAVDVVKDKVEEAGKGFLEFAETELETARKSREGRVEVRPSGDTAAEIAARIEASVQTAETSKKALAERSAATPAATTATKPSAKGEAAEATAAPSTEEERRAKAEAELARLKAELKDKLYGSE